MGRQVDHLGLVDLELIRKLLGEDLVMPIAQIREHPSDYRIFYKVIVNIEATISIRGATGTRTATSRPGWSLFRPDHPTILGRCSLSVPERPRRLGRLASTGRRVFRGG